VGGALYQRVLSSGKIRAAYTIYPPGCFRDQDGRLRGVFVETLERAAADLNLEVEWTEEVGWATQIEGLRKGRYDIIGSSVWANPKRAREATLSTPLYFSPLFVYARSGEKRFSGARTEELNQEGVRFSTVDGGTGEVVVKGQFPKAQRVALPQLSDFGQSFLDVVHGKADVVIMEPFHANKFLSSHPDSIKNLSGDDPLRLFGNCYMFAAGEQAFANMLNEVLRDLLQAGFVEHLLAGYEQFSGSYLRVAPPYAKPN
jgi:ABC-type amino acid transport substrate-binding protein